MKYLSGIIFFGILVFVHELGHFAVAKLSGIKVEKFSIGFGKALLFRMYRGTKYMISLIPLGGYVKLQGDEIGKEEYLPGDFYYAGWKKRTLLVLAGPVMNIFLAYFLFSVYFYHTGMVRVDENAVVGEVIEGYPAEKAGFKPGDKVLEITGKNIGNWQDMSVVISGYPEQEISITIEREETIRKISVTPLKSETGQGKIGIKPQYIHTPVSFFKSIDYGLNAGNMMIVGIFKGLWEIVAGGGKVQFMGPIGIMHMSYETLKTGFGEFIFLIGAMSVSVGIINLFPIPVLDGGHILLNLIEAVRRKRASEKTLKIVNAIGLFILLFIFISASAGDVSRIFLSRKL